MIRIPSCRRALIVACAIVTITALSAHAGPKERPSFAQVFKNAEPRLTKQLPNVSGWADATHYLETRRPPAGGRPTTYLVNATTGSDSVQPDLQQFAGLMTAEIEPGSHVATMPAAGLYLYSAGTDLYYLDTRAKVFKRLTSTPAEEHTPVFSPDGKHIAFTRDHDLFSVEIATGKETRYTMDGASLIYNGWAAWLYYEEILGRASQYRAFWWSPDSRSIAFYRFDETLVPEFPIYVAAGVHGTLEHTRYPKAGDPNPVVRIGIVPVGSPTITWAAFDEKQDQYFGPIFWTPDSKQLVIQWMNRGQDTLQLYGVNPGKGTRNLILTEHQDSWVEWYESIQFLKDNSGFIVQSDRDGWPHLFLYEMNGSLRAKLTGGDWAVTGIEAVDLATQTVFFTARKEVPTRTDLYAVRFDGKKMRRLTFGPYTHTVKVSPDGAYFVTTYSSVTEPPKMALVEGNGSVVRELGTSMTENFDKYELALPKMITIPTADGYALPAVMTLPFDFDPAEHYPVLISVYGGPNAASVFDGWRSLGGQWLAREGVIQLSVDHRGSGHFGKTGAALMHRKLGTWEMNDYIEAVKWLRAEGYVDSTRVCITGGSYGGYVTALALTAGAGYFTHGVAEYSVIDWHLYDSHYTERFMDSPAENPDGYKEASVLTHAHKYQGMMRLVHGTSDDNVHMQNSVQLVDTLENLNRRFEMVFYPGGRHGWGGPKAVHLRTDTYRFYYQYLIRKEFPEELFKTLDVASMRRRP
jgi:dipeptidyl-peptidase 4